MKELIEKAEKLGFLRFEEMKPSEISEQTYYLNLCLIQKFLRDENGVDVDVVSVKPNGCTFHINEVFSNQYNYTHEQALEEGIKTALKQLEN